MSARMVRTPAGPVEVAVVGEGPPVVLIHGTGGTFRQAMPIAEHLAARHTLVLPSRPGYGNTPLSTGRTPRQQADTYAALLDALDLGPAVILGISGGGPSTVAFAAHHADRCRGMVLASAVAAPLVQILPVMRLASIPGLMRRYAGREHRRRVEAIRDEGSFETLVSRMLTDAERRMFASDATLVARLRRFTDDVIEGGDGAAGIRNDLDQVRAKQPDDAPSVTVPTLVLHGDPDVIVPVTHARHHARQISGAELAVFEGAGHMLLLTFPEDALLRIDSFLATVPV